MKKYYLLALVMIVALLAIGCSKNEGSTLTGATVGVDTGEEVKEETVPTSALKTEPTYSGVSILGKAGFEPAELTVKVGDTISWRNDDPVGKNVVLTFQNGKTRKFINSNQIKLGEEYSYTFTEAGEYSYWTVGDGVKAKLIVTE